MVRHTTKMRDFQFGDIVEIPWGLHTVRGRVHEVPDWPGRHRVVVMLEPELSDSIVAEPTTVTLPADEVTVVESV